MDKLRAVRSWFEEVVSNHKMGNNSSETSSRHRRTTEEPWHEETPSRREGSTTPSHGCRGIENRYNFKIGIYGWRKRCLYLLILGLLLMVIINLALTLWVLKVMEFSSEGMGQLRIVSGGLQLNGQAMVLDALIASTIRSRKGQPITIESSNDRLECTGRGLRVTDDRGDVVFAADRHEVVIGAEALRITGVGGAVFDRSVQTPLVRAESAHDLRLESPTRSLELRAPNSISIESRAGSITASCLTDLKLHSVVGAVRLEAGTVLMPTLPTASRLSRSSLDSTRSSSGGAHSAAAPQEIYQLCVCGDGRLFLAPPHGICSADESSRMCR